MKYRKKPVIVDAEQFVVWDMKKIPPFVTIHGVTYPVTKEATIIIPTLEGQHIASNLDWIIKGIKGEFYPCKPDVFPLIYEPVVELKADKLNDLNITPRPYNAGDRYE